MKNKVSTLASSANRSIKNSTARSRRIFAEDELEIHAVQCIHDHDSATAFVEGQNAQLKRHKLDALVASKESLYRDKYSHIVFAVDRDGNMVAGLQIYEFNPYILSPMQKALKLPLLDNQLFSFDYRSAEFCSLWASGVQKKGSLTARLIQQALLYSCDIGLDRLHAFVSPHVFKTAVNEGWQIDNRFGDNGSVLYPSPKYVSTTIAYTGLKLLKARYQQLRHYAPMPVESMQETQMLATA